MTETLKPCPFCSGKAALVYVDSDAWQVICDDCGSCSDYYDGNSPGRKEAIEAWNTRRVEDAQAAEIKRLREALEFILSATKEENPSIDALRFVAYTALKGREE